MPTIQLGAWPLEATMYEGEKTAGPVATLFAEDEEATREAISSHVDKAHSDYQRLTRCFFMPEIISMEEAISLIKKPR